MKNIDISLDEFAILPPEEQLEIMKNLIRTLSKKELMILKKMIDNKGT